jgi:hypothetical protein
MEYISNYQYYTNNGNIPEDTNWGSYQYLSLKDIVNNFMLFDVGADKLVDNVPRYEVVYHAKRAIQELNYDALKNIKVVDMEVGDNLKFILPADYINYVRMSILTDGCLTVINENRQANSSNAYLQDNNNDFLFDLDGQVITGQSALDIKRLEQSQYFGPGEYCGSYGWLYDDSWYFRYQLIGFRDDDKDGPTFRINNGVIDFTSGARNRTIVLEYISDGMENGDESLMTVNKLAEEFIYAYISYSILSRKVGIPEYQVKRLRDKKTAMWRNAKIRMSNLHPARIAMRMNNRFQNR